MASPKCGRDEEEEEQDALKVESRLSEFQVILANGDAHYISLKGIPYTPRQGVLRC